MTPHGLTPGPNGLWQATGEWIAGLWPWTVFATMTFRNEVSRRTAGMRFTVFKDRLVLRIGGHVGLAWFAKLQFRGVVHFHLLAATLEPGLRPVEPDDLIVSWPSRRDNCLVELVEGRGAAFYGAKHEHWDVNVGCPRSADCRRRKRCPVAPGPWPTPNELVPWLDARGT